MCTARRGAVRCGAGLDPKQVQQRCGAGTSCAAFSDELEAEAAGKTEEERQEEQTKDKLAQEAGTAIYEAFYAQVKKAKVAQRKRRK